ncbi:hypothetical protein mRhiFer1_008864 [Rhinolophus ferrumequinum]|uniref:Uncharacterized protein n=1 Tax=Rhinolophus ferrumequinum TaxID=59479 RepID=A0A7J8AG65_RHIFE|nr:hypothetical protein mRhiFer1_008864 [Rhinolophus ferrumequinum]
MQLRHDSLCISSTLFTSISGFIFFNLGGKKSKFLENTDHRSSLAKSCLPLFPQPDLWHFHPVLIHCLSSCFFSLVLPVCLSIAAISFSPPRTCLAFVLSPKGLHSTLSKSLLSHPLGSHATILPSGKSP